jgi:periplasmic protein TonB
MAAQAAGKRPFGALGRMSIVAAMHAALLLILARSFGITPPDIFRGGDLVTIDDPVRQDDPLPPPPNPEFVRQDFELVQPDLQIQTESPPDGGETITARTESTGAETGPGSAMPMPVIQNPRVDPRRPLSLPTYSPSYIRQGIEGFVDVEIYVLPDGRVGDARILRSSGFDGMDQSTLEEAKRRWRLLPATRDGAPIAQWHKLRVKFELKN